MLQIIDSRKLPSLESLRVRQPADEAYPPQAGKSRRTRSGTRLPRPWLCLRPPWRRRLCRGLATGLAMTNAFVNQLCENQ